MKIIDHLNRPDNTPRFSVEVIPPRRGRSAKKVYNVINDILPYDPPFIDVTSHSPAPIMREMPDGSFERVVLRHGPGTLGICSHIKQHTEVEPVPHILCNGFTKVNTEDVLIDFEFMGVENLLVIAGDAKIQNTNENGEANTYAIDLVNQIMDMNRAKYLTDIKNPEPTNFAVGVAAYPEKHFEAPNLDKDIQVLKMKEEAGADYAVTQMFFDNQKFFEFVEAARDAGVTIPIVPGMKIPNRKGNLRAIPRVFYCDFPKELVDRLEAANTKEEEEAIGVEWTAQQSMELLEAGYKNLHYYIMQNARPFVSMMEKLKVTA
jgi:methylenetetrahydrofolate reductase (NADPH)